MNSEKTLKNSVISVIAQILTLVIQFINRRIFIIFLDIEFLGYQSLFGNVFSLLSVAELGIGNIISFHLYKEIANDNKEEIGKLMYLYKWVYRIIAAVVLTAGLGCYFLLPYIVKNPAQSWSYLHKIYFLQLGSIVLGYFLSYRRTIYIADQKEYKCVQTDLYTTICVQIVQLSFLALFQNYILYLLIQLSSNIISNAVIAWKTNKDYPYLKEKYQIKKSDIQKRNMISDIKNFVVHKICYAVYGGTDNIVISACCGIRQVALYGNYFILQRGVMQVLFYKLLNPVQATIGNIIYSKREKSELWKQFQMLDIFSYFFATYIGFGFLLFFQPAIQLWMGKEYLLPMSFVAAYSVTIYLGAVFEIVYKYRSVFGDYKQDRNCMILSAVLNIIISVILAKFIGITGVQLGTLAAFLPIAYGRIRFVIRGFFGQSLMKYIIKHFLLSSLTCIEGLFLYFLVGRLPVNVGYILLRGIAWFFIPLIVGFCVFMKNPAFHEMLRYLLKMKKIIKQKLSKKKGYSIK